MSPLDEPPEWPWDRLLVFAIGCVLASIGSYVVIYRIFQRTFGIDETLLPNPLLWGKLAIIAGVALLATPWFPRGPLARRWERDRRSD